jgi:hypothetical protein
MCLSLIDFDIKFTYVVARWEGSTHDSCILADRLARPNGLKILEGKFYLVMMDMIVSLLFFHPSGQQGIISMSSLCGTILGTPTNYSISGTLQP